LGIEYSAESDAKAASAPLTVGAMSMRASTPRLWLIEMGLH